MDAILVTADKKIASNAKRYHVKAYYIHNETEYEELISIIYTQYTD